MVMGRFRQAQPPNDHINQGVVPISSKATEEGITSAGIRRRPGRGIGMYSSPEKGLSGGLVGPAQQEMWYKTFLGNYRSALGVDKQVSALGCTGACTAGCHHRMARQTRL